jgi:hypothetical protein
MDKVPQLFVAIKKLNITIMDVFLFQMDVLSMMEPIVNVPNVNPISNLTLSKMESLIHLFVVIIWQPLDSGIKQNLMKPLVLIKEPLQQEESHLFIQETLNVF